VENPTIPLDRLTQISSASAAEAEHPASLCSGECRDIRLWKIRRLSRPRRVGFASLLPRFDLGQRLLPGLVRPSIHSVKRRAASARTSEVTLGYWAFAAPAIASETTARPLNAAVADLIEGEVVMLVLPL